MKNIAYTKVKRGGNVQELLIQGAIELAEAVVDTLGPNGYTVIIDKANTDPIITQDGVTVARHIKLGHPIRNQGAQLLKQVANRAQSQSGDGTTTATLLAMEILKQILKLDGKTNFSYFKEGMMAALKDIESHVLANTITVDLNEESGYNILESVAFISANNDKIISDLIIEAIRHSKGVNPIKINEGRKSYSYVENLDGMIYYNSVHHDVFLDGLGVSNELILKGAKVFITDHDIVSLSDIALPLEHCFNAYSNEETRYPLVIVAPEFSKEALQILFKNISMMHNDGNRVQIIALKAPEFGIQQEYVLKDMAIYTGGMAIVKNEFSHLQDIENLNIEDILGTCEAHIKRDQYSLMNGEKNQDAFDKRINYINELIDEEEASYMKDKLMQRKAKLMGSISIIFVGAETEVEAKETLDRVDDAVNAVKGAIEQGVVKGGGVALFHASNDFAELRFEDKDFQLKQEDFKNGYYTLLNACKEPFCRIVENAEESVSHVKKILVSSDFNDTVNIRTGETVNIIDARILDPKKVTINSLKSAISVASLLTSTKTSITNFVGDSEE